MPFHAKFTFLWTGAGKAGTRQRNLYLQSSQPNNGHQMRENR